MVVTYGAAEHGTASGFQSKAHERKGAPINISAFLANLILPPMAFLYLSSLLTFHFHFYKPWVCQACVFLALLPALIAFQRGQAAQRRGFSSKWYMLSTFCFLFAFISGWVASSLNYWKFMQPFYAIEAQKTYSNIDPAQADGTRLMDAGKVYFADNAKLEIDMGMSFMHLDVYCVAPIVDKGNSVPASYDLWAVGTNCCRTDDPVFGCGQYDNTMARAAIRQTADDQRLYYRLAVQQAEAAYNIKANNPIFFHWVQDPDYEVSFMFQSGYKLWVLMNGMHFALNTFFLVFYLMLFARGHQYQGGPLTK